MGRAPYNRLQYKQRSHPQHGFISWQTRDYRSIPDVSAYAEKPLPEELKSEEDLLIFEAHRRKGEKTVAIFADALDAAIDDYYQGKGFTDPALLVELFDILDESEQKPVAAWKRMQLYVAHDLERFFYNYITDQEDGSEMFTHVRPYVRGNPWFDFLQITLSHDPSPAMISRFLERKLPFDLRVEFLYYTIDEGKNELFIELYQALLKEIKTEEQFLVLLEVIFEYYTRNDFEEEETLLRQLIQQHKTLPFPPMDKKQIANLIQ